MKRVARVAISFGVTAAFSGAPGFALDIDPTSRQKAIAAATVGTAPAPAPGISHNPLPDLPNGMDANGRGLSGGCTAGGTDLCYDYKERRLVYRPTRSWMPEIEGLKAEHISVRRDSVVLRYSFK
jgi:hypothetical protein